jgi:hypothetical protein
MPATSATILSKLPANQSLRLCCGCYNPKFTTARRYCGESRMQSGGWCEENSPTSTLLKDIGSLAAGRVARGPARSRAGRSVATLGSARRKSRLPGRSHVRHANSAKCSQIWNFLRPRLHRFDFVDCALHRIDGVKERGHSRADRGCMWAQPDICSDHRVKTSPSRPMRRGGGIRSGGRQPPSSFVTDGTGLPTWS